MSDESAITMKPIVPLAAAVISGLALCAAAISPTPASAAPKKVLVVSTCEGFRHSCIPLGNQILGLLGLQSGAFTVDVVDVNPNDPQFLGADGKPDKAKVHEANAKALAAKMNPDTLKTYDALVFNCTTGQLPGFTEEGLLDWIASGKGFVGIHAATDTFHSKGTNVSPYIQMIGGEFKTHGPQVQVDVINQDPNHAACKHLPDTWTVFDEIYLFKNFERPKIHGLLTMDKHPNEKTPGDYPVAWCKQFGQGRVFYTSLGHREDVWDPVWKEKNGQRKDPPQVAQDFQKHLLGGILWALGLEAGDAKPQVIP